MKRDGRYWIMPDGTRVPYIAGGSGDDDIEKLKEQIAQLKDQLKQTNAESAARRHELREYQEKLKQFEGIDMEEIKALKEKARQAEEERMRKEGEFEKILERREAEWKQKLEQVQQKYQDLEQRYQKVAIDERLVSAFAKAGAVAPEEAAALTRSLAALDDDGVYVLGDDGKTPLVKDGKRVSLEEFAQQWLEQRPHHRKAGPQGSGSPGGSRGGAGDKIITRAEFDALAPDKQAEIAKGGYKIVDE